MHVGLLHARVYVSFLWRCWSDNIVFDPFQQFPRVYCRGRLLARDCYKRPLLSDVARVCGCLRLSAAACLSLAGQLLYIAVASHGAYRLVCLLVCLPVCTNLWICVCSCLWLGSCNARPENNHVVTTNSLTDRRRIFNWQTLTSF